MSITWIMVANASQAKLYENQGPNKGLHLLRELSHPESREKAAQLVSDRVGNFQGSGSYAQHTDPKHHEMERFAHQVAGTLEDGRVKNAFEKLVLVASTPFLGMLNQRLSSQLQGRVSLSLDKDYTKATDKELAGHLGAHMRL